MRALSGKNRPCHRWRPRAWHWPCSGVRPLSTKARMSSSPTWRAFPNWNEIKTRFGAEADKVSYVEADVTNPADVEAAVAHAVDHFSGLDILVNNGGCGTGFS